jgi:osmotically-inducible protein OsmY
MTNEALERNVTDELLWDPHIDSGAIAVSADDGVVTLRGTVGSFRQKREVKRAVERVYGVTKVNNKLDVRVLTEHRRQDAEIRGDVLQALMLDAMVPTTIDAMVKDGIVTLTGTVEWRYQYDEAEFVAANILGVIDVENDVDILSLIPDAGEMHHSITKALERNATLDVANIAVSSSHGRVTLTGSVRSWSEHDAAVAAAWSAPGVITVDDRLRVNY